LNLPSGELLRKDGRSRWFRTRTGGQGCGGQKADHYQIQQE
jgi:hypothetical protein